MRKRARTCPLCKVRLTAKPGLPNSKHLDHIIPIAAGGTHTHGNVRIICRTCNLGRPKDGSDYSGPVTLWAQGEVPVKRPRKQQPPRCWPGGTCRRGLHPWVAENIGRNATTGTLFCRGCRRDREQERGEGGIPRECSACGAPFPAPGRQLMCAACIDVAAHRAAELHASGLSWAQVAALVGYSTGEGARYAAKRIGYVPQPAWSATVRERWRRECGAAIPDGSAPCPGCAHPAA